MNFTDPLVLTPIVTAVGQVIKRMGMPSRFMPFVAVLLGIGAVLLLGIGTTIATTILTGVVIGLASSGLYEVTIKPDIKKAVAKAKTSE